VTKAREFDKGKGSKEARVAKGSKKKAKRAAKAANQWCSGENDDSLHCIQICQTHLLSFIYSSEGLKAKSEQQGRVKENKEKETKEKNGREQGSKEGKGRAKERARERTEE
jgi:Fe-S-cluster-containing hydrogenase component 2